MTFLKGAFLLVLLSACSLINAPADHQGGDGGVLADAETDGGPSLTDDEYCARFAELMCGANANCCDDREQPFQDCEIILRQECAEIHGPSPRLPAEFLAFDGVPAAEAIANLEILTAACNPDVVRWAVDDFIAPLDGARQSFATCTPPQPLTARGIIHAALSCDRSEMSDAMCQPSGGQEWQCNLRRPTGGECYLGLQCISNLCTPNSFIPGIFPGTCSNGLDTGEVCQPSRSDQCASLVCQQEAVDVWTCAERTPANVYCRTM